MITTIETQSRSQIFSLIQNGAPMYVSVMEGELQRVHPVVLNNTIFIPVHHKGFTWIERLGPGAKEKLSTLISVMFQWEDGCKDLSINDVLEGGISLETEEEEGSEFDGEEFLEDFDEDTCA